MQKFFVYFQQVIASETGVAVLGFPDEVVELVLEIVYMPLNRLLHIFYRLKLLGNFLLHYSHLVLLGHRVYFDKIVVQSAIIVILQKGYDIIIIHA